MVTPIFPLRLPTKTLETRASRWYNEPVKRKSLFEDNGFSKDPVAYGRFLVETVAASTAIEIGPLPEKMLRELKEHSRHPQKIHIGK